MKIRTLLFILVFLLVFSGASYCDSLWNNGNGSPYSSHKSLKVGDIIVVIVLENTQAAQKAGTDTSNKDDLSLSYTHTISRLTDLLGAASTPQGITGSLGNAYKGVGQTGRSSNVKAKVATKVTKILGNGNVMLEGIHKLEINNETQQIFLSGVIRSKDVSLANTIYSYQVADAMVSVKGSGTVDEGSEPGWLTRIFNAIF